MEDLDMDHHRDGLAADLDPLLEIAASRRQSLRWLLSGVAALPLAGCGGSTTAAASTSPRPPAAAPAARQHGIDRQHRQQLRPHPRGNRRPVSRRRHQQQRQRHRQCADPVRHRAQRHPHQRRPGSATAQGIPLTIRLQLVNVGASCAAIAGATVYLWHCDRDGNYSMYASGLTKENYLRGVQAADADGYVSFTTIFPGCYAGRMPHVHFEVFPSLAKAASAAGRIKTSQFTFPMATLNEVYANTAYAASSRNLASISYATDNVFSDGTSLQMASVSGDAATATPSR
jgi:protocatechuate 3,4-dioxygenase beta subunit